MHVVCKSEDISHVHMVSKILEEYWYSKFTIPSTNPEFVQTTELQQLILSFPFASIRARNSARIRESILAMILVASRYENQFLSLNYVVNTTVTQNFDSRKSKRNSTPASMMSFDVYSTESSHFKFKLETQVSKFTQPTQQKNLSFVRSHSSFIPKPLDLLGFKFWKYLRKKTWDWKPPRQFTWRKASSCSSSF